jgi:hypothetical protein
MSFEIESSLLMFQNKGEKLHKLSPSNNWLEKFNQSTEQAKMISATFKKYLNVDVDPTRVVLCIYKTLSP